MVWHLEFRSELEISDYFNDSGKTSPNDRQILDGGKIASLLLADFMEFRFLLRICPRYIASLGHYWIAALGSQSKWPNSGGEMIELWSIWLAICLLRFWLSKKGKKEPLLLFPQTLSGLLLRCVALLWLCLGNYSFSRSKSSIFAHHELISETSKRKNVFQNKRNSACDKFLQKLKIIFWINSNWT